MYQFENNEGLICRFFQTLVNILIKKIPKRNSMLITFPPFSDGAGKRLVILNEPNYEVSHLEKMKELIGGDTTRVQ
ncbi:SF3 helicase domain-containing protein [Aphis craccivora]|uniref:SF3 helicase domain-containing protein n=1 Tax=Aphis craccivora TaxID=307492 RepID=A0A6G0YPA2_APHCR|nr:SF3 helicase domain-containing protein [Aphis craccivora]